ncbi:hypothetical protein [Candidatus Formimonas warabiya]|nr:hypothetical protein [Candidatus Formimonas warabiya]
MVINTGTVLAMRCPKCGKLNFHAISLFAFSGKSSVCFDCDCGASSVVIATSNYKKFTLKTDCGMCETNHLFYLSYKELFSPEAFPLVCLDTGLEIGFVGSKEKVKDAVKNQERTFADLIEDTGFEEFFDNPDVMYQVLEYLNNISAEGAITCKCGNHNIDLDILPDRLEMVCSDCGNRGIIFAETKEDLLTLKQLGKIELSDQGFVIKNVHKPKRKKGQWKK